MEVECKGQVGPFEVVELAGQGAMAQVWRAVHQTLRMPVALKVMTAEHAQDYDFQARFAHEIRCVSRLNHRGIIRLYDHGVMPEVVEPPNPVTFAPGTPYCLMEWVNGGTLQQKVGRMQWAELRATPLTLLDSLAAAHANGIIHRDLKPQNVLLSSRGPILSDFGIAYGQDISEKKHQAHTFVGTPNYMPPEQFRGDWRSFGPWTDLYALGCVTYTILCGGPPFRVRSFADAMSAHVATEIPRLQPRVPIPDGFDQWIRRLMAKRPEDRFQLAADAAIALLEYPDVIPLLNSDGKAVGTWQDGEQTIVAPPAFVPVTETVWQDRRSQTEVPPLPSTWRPARARPDLHPIPGLGRALFSVSSSPLCGHIDERTVL